MELEAPLSTEPLRIFQEMSGFLLKSRSMTVQDIRREIEMLSPGEVSELQAWLNQQESYEEAVDSKFKAALDAGKFDKLIDEVIADQNPNHASVRFNSEGM